MIGIAYAASVDFFSAEKPRMKKRYSIIALLALFLATGNGAFAQTGLPDTTGKTYTLGECISIALQNQPAVRQAMLDEEIADRQIKASLSGWAPQINGAANYNRNLELPVSFFPNQATGERTAVRIGVYNTSNFLVEARQNLFTSELYLASRNAKPLRKYFGQITEEVKISTVVSVSKAYYDILISQEQLSILFQVRDRQQKQLDDAKALYEGGLVDPTDYKRATIALNNTLADIKRTTESLNFKYAYLRQLMGVDQKDGFAVRFDKQSMETEMMLDTTQLVDFNNRVEMQQLQTQKKLQNIAVAGQKWNLFPTIWAFANRNHVFQSDEFAHLYDAMYPSSVIGVSLALPIFQGGRRFHNIQQQKLVNQRLDEDIKNTKNIINTQYEQSLALYKSDLNDYKTATANVALSEEVYTTIKLQYDEGIRAYLDLMVAENDLRVAQINQLNTILNVLSSKLDVLQSLGIINTNQ